MTLKLPLYEWCIILLFCGILISLAAFAALGQSTLALKQKSSDSDITVTSSSKRNLTVNIQGQVAHPGPYSLPHGTSLKDLLCKAEPLPTADLSQLHWRRKLRDGQTIDIPERVWITVQVVGAVQQPGHIKILSGTRLCELANQLQFQPDADLKSFCSKKRFLYDGDLVEVAIKKGRKNRKYAPTECCKA